MSTEKRYPLFVSCPKGVERLLIKELSAFQLQQCKETVGGVFAQATLSQLYHACLYSRLANRVILVLVQQTFADEQALYQLANTVPWSAYFDENKSFAVDFKGTNNSIRHTQFGALRVKDGIVDYFQMLMDKRPNVDVKTPDVQISAHIRRNQLTLGIELSGGSLHQRFYRVDGALAPLKENLAAALIDDTGFAENDERIVIDPMCGSGTLLIEAVLKKLAIAPALLRQHFAFTQLSFHNHSLWQSLLQQAQQHKQQQLAQINTPLAYGFDQDKRMIDAANANAEQAGLSKLIVFKQQALQDFVWQQDVPRLLVTNPPYGERLSERNALFSLYQLLGEKCREYAQGYSAWVLCSDDYLLKALSLQKSKSHGFFNGALAVQWVQFMLYRKENSSVVQDEAFLQGVTMVENRLKKNQKNLANWLTQKEIHCYRIYDADIPEYAFAVDCYAGQYQVAEYAPPKTVDAFAAFNRRQQFLQAMKNVWQLKDSQIIVKQRKQQKGKQQYEKVDSQKHFFTVQEGSAKLLVNITDYLDTGLFLDHRLARLMLADMAKGKRFLNLFCYTAAATVHAALGGAESSLSLDMSQTYLDWAERNFKKNRLDSNRHQLQREDVLQWLEKQKHAEQFDVIFLDPPSFSNSKRMQDVLDIQRDHKKLIQQTMYLLDKQGCLIFSNNRQGFKLDEELAQQFHIENISAKTIDKDFQRNQKIHQCWLIRHQTQE